jgi:hypothetical protein
MQLTGGTKRLEKSGRPQSIAHILLPILKRGRSLSFLIMQAKVYSPSDSGKRRRNPSILSVVSLSHHNHQHQGTQPQVQTPTPVQKRNHRNCKSALSIHTHAQKSFTASSLRSASQRETVSYDAPHRVVVLV